MEKLTQIQVEIAQQIILNCGNEFSTDASKIFGKPSFSIKEVDDLEEAVYFLKKVGLIKVNAHKGGEDYLLTDEGNKFFRNKKTIAELINAELLKEKQKNEKVELEDRIKMMQFQDLEIKLKSVEEMQERQKVFWESGIERDRRQKWQFWLTFFLATGGFLMGILNFIKSLLFSN